MSIVLAVPGVDPRDPTAVAERIAAWASSRFGGPVTIAVPATSVAGGFDSYLHFVDLDGAALPAAWRSPLVVRLLPSVDRVEQAEREAAVQGWAADLGYPAPRVLAVLDPDDGLGLPTQVMERATGTTMLAAVTSRPWRALQLVDRLASLAVALHALPTDAWPGATEPARLVDQRLSLPRRVVAELDVPELAAALGRAETMAPQALGAESVACHGDFHPLNVVIGDGTAAVIDWTDAALGPREADVARTLLLFNMAAVATDRRVERVALRVAAPRLEKRYRQAYESAHRLDPTLLRRWEVLHAVHGWAQIEMLHAGGFEGESSADAADVPAAVSRLLRVRIERALSLLGD